MESSRSFLDVPPQIRKRMEACQTQDGLKALHEMTASLTDALRASYARLIACGVQPSFPNPDGDR